ncbi:esterase family protein [Spirosoma taeanense]|uniref:Esterase family protein n=1 Tax=Spirosoma taeanense TaxID=2735870 RepID=A0A6M5Y913_9BACT|nr:alpha/beta hydrolase family protein [Spirosoma taeanense]QJW89984.1 esterase family protein [Spirosoma taeanense]
MNKRFLLSIACFLLINLSVRAGRVDTIQVESKAMHKAIKCVVITPDRYSTAASERFPVVYLLHGYSGNHSDWIRKAPELTSYADRYGVIIACPDGQNSWYLDSPVNPAKRFETFVTGELLPYMDANYRTQADRQHRAITGLSMGGHGALYLAVRHRDLFGQAGSLSGGVDLRPFPNNWDLKNLLGEEATNQSNWDTHSVINVIDSLQNGDLRLMVECGTADFFYEVNRNLHQKLLQRAIAHDYIERPGAHTWDYWRGNIEYQLLFFRKGFPEEK